MTIYIYNTFVMFSHDKSVIPNVFANNKSYNKLLENLKKNFQDY